MNFIFGLMLCIVSQSFPPEFFFGSSGRRRSPPLYAGGGFGKPSGGFGKPREQNRQKKKTSQQLDPTKSLADQFNLTNAAVTASSGQSPVDPSPIGRAVKSLGDNCDEFFSLLPSLIKSRFPDIRDDELKRVGSFVLFYFLKDKSDLPAEIVGDKFRPHQVSFGSNWGVP